MKKKVLIALTVVFVLAFAVPAFAALTDVQKQEILDLHKQMVDLRKQMIDKYVDAGEITADQGQAIKDRMDQAEKYRQDNGILPGAGIVSGRGCGGFGGGAGGGCGMGGFGGKAGFGGIPQGAFGNIN